MDRYDIRHVTRELPNTRDVVSPPVTPYRSEGKEVAVELVISLRCFTIESIKPHKYICSTRRICKKYLTCAGVSPALSRLVPPDRFVLPGFRLLAVRPRLPPPVSPRGIPSPPTCFTGTLLAAAWRISPSRDLSSAASRCLCSVTGVSDPPSVLLCSACRPPVGLVALPPPHRSRWPTPDFQLLLTPRTRKRLALLTTRRGLALAGYTELVGWGGHWGGRLRCDRPMPVSVVP